MSRSRWRQNRARFLASEIASDNASRALELRQAEHLRLESEAFLARQMDEMRSLAEEQRKAGLLLDDGAPVRLAISGSGISFGKVPAPVSTTSGGAGDGLDVKERKDGAAPRAGVFGQDDEEDEDGLGGTRRKGLGQLVKLDFEAAEGERAMERMNKVRDGVSKVAESLWKVKIKWEAITDVSFVFDIQLN